MVKREQSRATLERKLASHVLAAGLGQASLRQLARAAGTSDRMLLYYFTDKADLLTSVLGRIAAEMTAALEAAVPLGERMDAGSLLRRTAAIALQPTMRPYMELWAEIAAEAARGHAPFVDIAEAIAAGFAQWTEARLDESDPERRAALGALLIVAVDGAALLAPLGEGALAAGAIGVLGDLLDR